MRSRSKFLTVIILIVLLLSPFVGMSNAASASSVAAVVAPQTVFGAEMDQITQARGLNQLVAANATWTRRNALIWSSVESTEGARDWNAVASLESELQAASANGLQVILEVRSTPEWARKIAGSGSSCGPIRADKLAAFGAFMHDLVARYSAPPYNIKVW